MIINSEKNITRSSWDTILMPDTFITCVKEIVCNEPNHFIFTDRSCCNIGDIEITVVDRDADDSTKNQAPQDPPH